MPPEPITSFSGKHAFLSNFQLCDIEYDGVMYLSVEHAYQAAKTLDPLERHEVASAETPGKAKRAGRCVTLREDWDEIKIEVMRDLLWKKFCEGPLKAALLATAPRELVEGNWWGDQFWGCSRGAGENWLGRLLMEVRTELVPDAEGDNANG